MDSCGIFGKVPSAGDFLSRNLPIRVTEAWADTMSGWMAAAKPVDPAAWPAQFTTSPVWRFLIGRGVLGPSAWVGMFAGSTDRVGRLFPMTVMISVGADVSPRRPDPDIDRTLDRVEMRLLAFIAGSEDEASLLGALKPAAGDLRMALSILGDSPAMEIDEGAAAVCRVKSSTAGGAETAFSWPGNHGSSAARSLCVWWHEETGNRPAELCVSRGFLDHRAALPLFWSGWADHGWRPLAAETTR